jgi:erythromycin esterase
MFKYFIICLFIINLTTYAAIDEIRENAIKSQINLNSLNKDESNFLNKGILDKKFVFLGEADHFFEEKYAYRLKFIEFLLSKGYTHILDEMGISDGEMVQRYLETGNEDYLKKVGLYGFKYGQPLAESSRKFVLSSKRYLRKLRKLKQKYPGLIYGGFDLDMYPGTTYLQLDEFFERNKKTYLEKLKVLINVSKKHSGQLQAITLDTAYKNFLNIKNKLANDLSKKDLIHLELILRNFLRSVELREKFKTGKDIFNVLAWREEQMFKNMIARSELDPEDQKYILLGHNGHLTKTVKDYRDLNGVQQWYAIGSWVNDNYPNQSYAIWSLIGHGEHSGHGCEGGKTCYFSAPKNTLEYELLKIENKNTLLVSTQLESFSNENRIIKTLVNGIEILEGPLADQADAIYFIPEVSDVRP